MNKYTRLYLNYTKCGPFFNDYMGEFLVSIYISTFHTKNFYSAVFQWNANAIQ